MSEEKKVTLIDLAERTMVQSMLVFVLADLRILSSAGKLHTKYERLCIDSDKVRKQSAQEFALHTSPDYESRGVSAAHIMAVLLLEITRAADHLNFDRKPAAAGVQDSLILDKKTINAATSMPSLITYCREMIKSDLTGDAQKIRKKDLSFPSPLNQQINLSESVVSEVSALSPKFNPDIDTDDDDEASDFTAKLIKGKSRAKFAMKKIVEDSKTLNEVNKLQSQLFIEEGGEDSEFYSKQEVLHMLDQATESRDEQHVRFIERFFKDGSISKNLIQSKSETVWINDWNQKYECTYAIAIDREKKNVLFAFRGKRKEV